MPEDRKLSGLQKTIKTTAMNIFNRSKTVTKRKIMEWERSPARAWSLYLTSVDLQS
jgi:hypothetical protein